VSMNVKVYTRTVEKDREEGAGFAR
jgi:hypothetical protein